MKAVAGGVVLLASTLGPSPRPRLVLWMRRELQRFLTLLAVAAPALSGCGGDERSAASSARGYGELRPESAVVTGSERLPSDLPGRIAFQSDRTGRAKIFVLDHEGVHQITRGPGNDKNPKWSPDGKQIAFSSDRDGNEEIYVVGADGSGLRRLTDHPARDRNPAWSPDGRFLVYDTRRWAVPTLWVMRRDGTDRRRVTRSVPDDRYLVVNYNFPRLG